MLLKFKGTMEYENTIWTVPRPFCSKTRCTGRLIVSLHILTRSGAAQVFAMYVSNVKLQLPAALFPSRPWPWLVGNLLSAAMTITYEFILTAPGRTDVLSFASVYGGTAFRGS